ncbi:MAG: hypothetical protein WAL71_11915 [Terriglobales bacterium]|jgi:hypothetical protein
MTVRRIKTYASSQGYAYQYYFAGKRPAMADADTTEYIFDVTSDREVTYPVSIFFPRAAALAWAESHGRLLSDSEQYAGVKLRLFRAFDEVTDLKASGPLWVDADFLEEALAGLGVE